MGIKSFRFIRLLLTLSTLGGCLKNNGEPYPGTASRNVPDASEGDYEIDFPDGSIDEKIICSHPQAGARIQSRLSVSADHSLALEVTRIQAEGPSSVLTQASIVEAHTDTSRNYYGGTARLNISRTPTGPGFVGTLRYKSAGSSTWSEALAVSCNSSGYSEDR